MVLSTGNEEKVKVAVNHIRYAVLGIIILMVILFVAPIFLGLFGLQEYSTYFSPPLILSTIQEVAANILGTSSDAMTNSSTTINVNSDAFSSLD